jgi:hypothetical protein
MLYLVFVERDLVREEWVGREEEVRPRRET